MRTPWRPASGHCSMTMTCRADSESVIEESPLAQEPEPEVETAPEAETQVTEEIAVGDPAWVQEMFAEAEADAVRSRTAEHRTLDPMPDDATARNPPWCAQRATSDGVSAVSGDTVLEPLLDQPVQRPAWQYTTGIALLLLVLLLQILHFNRQNLVLSPSFGSAHQYGLRMVRRHAHAALGSQRVFRETARRRSRRRRRHAAASKAVGAERQRSRATAAAVTPHAAGSIWQCGRDARSRARANTCRHARPASVCSNRTSASTRSCTSSIPGKAAIGFEIDACLRGEGGSIGCANDAAPPQRPAEAARLTCASDLTSSARNVVLAPMAGVTDRPFRVIADSSARDSRRQK